MVTANPRLRVREARLADVDAITDINFAAFDDNIMNQLMYPGGVSADSREKFGSKVFPQRTAESEAEGSSKKSQGFLCVAEYSPEDSPSDGPGEVVAFAKWQLHPEPRTEEEWKGEDFTATAEICGEGCDVGVVNAFIGGMTRVQRDHAKGEAALYLGIIACSPARQRLGAGSALMEWGVNLADSLGLPCRLEASPTGYGLYKKFGYEDVDVLDLTVTETWGAANTSGSNWGANNAVTLAGPVPDGVLRSMDPVSAAANIIAIIHGANRLIALCKRFLEVMRDAPGDLRLILVEVSTLKAILDDLHFLVSCNHGPTILDTLTHDQGAIEGCRKVVSELEDLLPPECLLATDSKRKAESKAKALLEELRQYKSTIALALTTDSSLAQVVDVPGEDVQEQNVYNWLYVTDPSDLHEKSCDTYEPGTGEWLFRSPAWGSWLEEKTRCLWVHGIPGAGKTIFASHLIETVREHCEDRGSKYACVYYYCYFGHSQDETAPFLRWILLELCRRLGRVPLAVHELYRRGGKPTSRTLLAALENLVQAFDRVFIFVDAVDESLDRENLLRVLEDLAGHARFNNVRLLATSREYIDIEDTMKGVSTPISMRNPLLDEDIALYIRSKLDTHPRLKRWPRPVREEVLKALSTEANGMFRWVVCQIDALQRLKPESSIIATALNNLPKTLDETYERVFLRIPEDARLFVQHALHWLCTHRLIHQAIPGVQSPATCDFSRIDVPRGIAIPCEVLFGAVQQSLAKEELCDPMFLDGYVLDEELLRELCGCLVTLTSYPIRSFGRTVEEMPVVSFAHYTVLEFLESRRIRGGPAAPFALDRDRVFVEHAIVLFLGAAASADRWSLELPQKPGSDVYSDFDRYCAQSSALLLHWHVGALTSSGTTTWIAPLVELLQVRAPYLGSYFWYPPESFARLENPISPAIAAFRRVYKLRTLSPPPEPHLETLVRMLQVNEQGGLARAFLANLCRASNDFAIQLDLEFQPGVFFRRPSESSEQRGAEAHLSEILSFRGSVLEFYAHLPGGTWAQPCQGLYDILEFAAGHFDPSKIIGASSPCWGCLLLKRLLHLGAQSTIAATLSDLAGVKLLLEAGIDPNDIGDLRGNIGTPDRGPMLKPFSFVRGRSSLNIVRQRHVTSVWLKTANVWFRDHTISEAGPLEAILIQYGARDFTTSLDDGHLLADETKMLSISRDRGDMV
ncbi:hypothetical protein C8A00DRAFT_41316 [Chaetomidium leptoderma]|uniref:NACHT domain-containing protein n=1 Tax=Chaetomidium leptoderma TaxID=669021 RepID=A0AAN6ZZ50_9PEZI|nr:hypothetical protein C8A00DRAFT_41316 [Chaetomidium leptoderma]